MYTWLRLFILEGKDQCTRCPAHHGELLLCPCLKTACKFFGYFSGLVIAASPASNGSWWASNIRPSIERRRRNHFIKTTKLTPIWPLSLAGESFMVSFPKPLKGNDRFLRKRKKKFVSAPLPTKRENITPFS